MGECRSTAEHQLSKLLDYLAIGNRTCGNTVSVA